MNKLSQTCSTTTIWEQDGTVTTITVQAGTLTMEQRHEGLLLRKVVRMGRTWYENGEEITSVHKVMRLMDMVDSIFATRDQASVQMSTSEQ